MRLYHYRQVSISALYPQAVKVGGSPGVERVKEEREGEGGMGREEGGGRRVDGGGRREEGGGRREEGGGRDGGKDTLSAFYQTAGALFHHFHM